jgi:hypothetical protein
MAGFPDMYPGTRQQEAGEIAGKAFQRGGKSASFYVWSYLLPHALKVTGDLD